MHFKYIFEINGVLKIEFQMRLLFCEFKKSIKNALKWPATWGY